MKKSIIDKIVNDSNYKKLCYNIAQGNELWEDLYQYVMMQVLELPEERLVEISKTNIGGYINRIAWYSWNSAKAPFNRLYRFEYSQLTNTEIQIEDEDIECIISQIESSIENEIKKSKRNNIEPFHVDLLKLHAEGWSLHKIAKEANMPYPTVRYIVSELIKTIHEDFTNNRENINRP